MPSDTAASLAAAVASGAVTPAALLAEHVARHVASHERTNALVQPRHGEAGLEAAAVEAGLRDAPAGPLAGVPVSVKECFAVRGLRTTLGLPSRHGLVDAADAPLVATLRAAGAIVVGKANVPQAMFLHETDNPVWGRTNHPEAADRGPGGSSGGDAALVAAGVVPLGVGNDLAGSVRQPAHACGIVGFVPAATRLGDGGAFLTLPHLTVMRARAGFLARSVDDVALACAATGSLRGAPAAAARQATGPHVAWWDAAGPIEPSAAIRRGVGEAVARRAAAGCTVTRVDGGLADEAAWIHLALTSADGGADIRRLFGTDRPIPPIARLLRFAGVPAWLRPVLAAVADATGSRLEARALRRTGPRAGVALERLLDARREVAGRFAALVGGFDAVVCPVSALPALRHGTAGRLVLAAAPCLLANLLDLPAGTVPVTRVRPEEEVGRAAARDPLLREAAATDRGSGGLPVGVQVIGVPEAVGGAATDPGRVVLDVMRLIERPLDRC